MTEHRIQQIFQKSDINGDGGLDKNEFGKLIKYVNSDVELHDEQVGLILNEVWKTYPSLIGPKGLTLEGLKKIYIDGLADADRDYDALIKAHRGQTIPTDSPVVSHVSGGRLAMAARNQPPLADSSPFSTSTPSLPASPDVFGNLVTPAPPKNKDIFDALESPITPDTTTNDILLEDLDNSLAFAIRLPSIPTEEDFLTRAMQRHIVSALQAALPDGSSAKIDPSSIVSTPTGMIIGATCTLSVGSMNSEETEYFRAVMRVEPEQVFPRSTFGSVEVLAGDAKAAQGTVLAARAAAKVLSAYALAGTVDKAAMAFAVRLPKVDKQGFLSVRGGQFMALLRTALPRKSMARVIDVADTAQGCIVTVAATVPLQSVKHGQQFCKKARRDPGSIFDSKVFGPPWMIALVPLTQAAPALGIQVHVPLTQKSSHDKQTTWHSSILAALEKMLPDGSSKPLLVSTTKQPSRGITVASVAAILPVHLPGEDAPSLHKQLCDRLQGASLRVEGDSDAAAGWSMGGTPRIQAVGDAFELALDVSHKTEQHGLDALGDEKKDESAVAHDLYATLHFGLPSPPRSPSVSPTRTPKSPTLFGRLFGGTTGNANAIATAAAAAAQSPPADAIIAGYQRRASSAGSGKSSSGGLAEAVDPVGGTDNEDDEASSTSPVAAAAHAALIAAKEVTPLKLHNPSEVTIQVMAFPIEGESKAEREGENDVDVVDIEPSTTPRGPQDEADAEVEEARDAARVPPQEGASTTKPGGGWRALLDRFSPKKRKVQDPPAVADGDVQHGNSKNAPAPVLGPVGSGTTDGISRPVLTPWEIQQKQDAKEWAVMESQVNQILAKLTCVLENAQSTSPASLASEISAVQGTASLLPPWARHAAHMEIGERLSQHDMYEEALRSYKEAAAAWPEDPLARFRLGNAHFALFQFHDASRSYFDALRRCNEGDPLLVKVHINMGISLESEGLMEAAEREYGRASMLAPNHPRVHKLLGSARYACGDYNGAAEALKKALEINPDFADAWADMGCAQAALGDAAEAERCLAVAIDIEPNHIEAHFNTGNILRQRYDFSHALHHYDTVLRLDPRHWRSLLNKSVVLAQLGWRSRSTTDAGSVAAAKKRHSEAARCLQQALLHSGHGSTLVKEVDGLRELMSRGAALEEMSRAVSAIEDKARRADIVAVATSQGTTTSASHSMSLSATLGRTKSGLAGLHRTASIADGAVVAAQDDDNDNDDAKSNSTSASGKTNSRVAASPRRVSSRTASVQSLSPTKSPQKLSEWVPLQYQPRAIDLGEEVTQRLRSMGVGDVPKILSSLDIPLIQHMQAVSNIVLDDIWSELRSSMERGVFENSRPKSKMIRLYDAEDVVHRLITLASRSTPCAVPALMQHAMRAVSQRVIGIMDFNETGYVDVAILLCVVVAMVDAPLRERLEASYRLLMWRSSDTAARGGGGAKGDPVTRGSLVELLSTLKAVFEAEHKTSYLSQRRQGALAAADTQFILYERFASDIQKFFAAYEALPLLSNPLK